MFTLKKITENGIETIGTFENYNKAFKTARQQAGTFYIETITEFGKHTYWC